MELKRAKVIMLPTNKNKKGTLTLGISGILHNSCSHPENNQYKNCNLYITTDDEIKEGDWVYESNLNTEKHIYKVCKRVKRLGFFRFTNVFIPLEGNNNAKKIIATTDKLEVINSKNNPELKDTYISRPTKAFIQKYVEEYNKGNQIVEVDVELENDLAQIHRLESIDCESEDYNFVKRIKVDSIHNTITIHPIKDSWSREELIELFIPFAKYILSMKEPTKGHVKIWIKENL